MTTYDSEFAARPGHVLRLTIDQGTQSQEGNWTDVIINLYLVRTASSSRTYAYDPQPWSINASGTPWSGASPYDFRSSSIIHLASVVKRMGHDEGGYSTIVVDATFSGGPLGSTSVRGVMSLTRIPKPPGAPLVSGVVGGTPLGFDQIATTSMRFRFSGTTDGGSPITGWEAQIAESPDFSVNPRTVASNGTTIFTGLKPGVMHYARARGANQARGWGPWSATASAKTLAAVYVSDGSKWLPAEIYVSNGSSWQGVEVLLSESGVWREPVAV
ncbi:fibronectin type III domain-containing protein [Microbacterium sp. XT11]|uniref:fibronectin type III domain-containing protein n=1 Tax=Microbacterium sp. XT11 TaxID=367477 RepID=UPI00083191E4|nr:fibronectin type III domain-containing protein [Microbacterium sp. XT11]